MTAEQIARMAAKASEGLTIKGILPKALQIAEANKGFSATLPETLPAAIASKTLAEVLPESLRIAGVGKSITATLPESAFVGPKLSPGFQEIAQVPARNPGGPGVEGCIARGAPAAIASKTLIGSLPKSALVGPKLSPALKGTLMQSLQDGQMDPPWKGAPTTALAAAKSSATPMGSLPKALQIAEASKGFSATLPEALRIAKIGEGLTSKGALPETLAASITSKMLLGSLRESALVGPKLSPGFQETLLKSLRGTPADPACKGTLAATLAGTTPALLQLPDVISIEGPKTRLPVPTRRQRQTGVRPVAPSDLPRVRPKILPQEVGEILATGLVRADREEVIFLLTDTGLDDARQHLEAIEERLLTGTGPSFLHAALSASLLLRDLADHLFPPQDKFWTSRFETRHPVGAQHVGNRLAAFVDSRLRSQLSPKEHRLFLATLDVVLRWTGEGHHVVSSPRETANAFRQLLEVLAAVARAYKSR